MAKATLDEVLESVKALPPDERQKLRELLDESLEESPLPGDDKLQRKLREAGLLTEMRLRVADLESYRSYKPIEVRGQPVSETLIEERR